MAEKEREAERDKGGNAILQSASAADTPSALLTVELPQIPEVSGDAVPAFRALTGQAIRVLYGIMTDSEAKDSDRIRAADLIIERGWGRPRQGEDAKAAEPQQVIFTGEDRIED